MKKLCAFFIAAAFAVALLPALLPRTEAFAAVQAGNEEAVLGELPETAAAPEGAYRLERVLPVAHGSVYRFARMEGGARVYGKEVAVSVDDAGNVLSVSGAYSPVKAAPALLSAAEAAEGYDALSVTPYIYEDEPAYEITTHHVRVMVSARDASVLFCAPLRAGAVTVQRDAFGREAVLDVMERGSEFVLADDVRNIYVYDAAHSERPEFASELIESRNGVFADAVAVSLFQNVVKAYDYYADADNIGTSLLGMDGADDLVAGNMGEGNGEFPINIYLHYGRRYENAAFGYDEGAQAGFMYVGDGNSAGVMYEPGKALDVIAHEYQHGVTQFACDLTYLNESGALNEAFSDIFGALIEGYDPADARFWSIGEDCAAGDRTDIRSMAGGTAGQRYSVTDEAPLCNRGTSFVHDHTSCDAGNVHANSTIASHVQYVACNKLPGYFTRERIGKLWYAMLCRLPVDATFDDFALEFMQAAADLGYPQEGLSALRESLAECGFIARGTQNDLHLVTFVNYDGTPVVSFVLRTGESVPFPAAQAERADDEMYTYTFRGWNLPTGRVTSDMVVTADFTRSFKTFRVRFLDAEGTVIAEEDVAYGEGAKAIPAAPEKQATAEDAYRFMGWDGDPSRITADTTFSPVYEAERVKYEAVYLSEGKLYRTLSVTYGQALPLDAPASSPGLFQKFEGWYTDEAHTMSAEGVIVTQNITLYAKWGYDPLPVILLAVPVFLLLLGLALALAFVFSSRHRKR